MKDIAVKLDDFLANYDATTGNTPDKTELPFQIVLSKEIQHTMEGAVKASRGSGNEWVAQLAFSNEKDAAVLINWVRGERHSASVTTKVTNEYFYRGTFHTHPPEAEIEVFKGMGYPPSATDINNLVQVKQNLISIVASDDRNALAPEIYLLVKTKQSKTTVNDDAMETLVTERVKSSRLVDDSKLYELASHSYNEVVLELCTNAFVGYYWGYLTDKLDGAIVLQNFGP
jgi:hypothetical protein